ncbi:MAG: heme-binding protein [Planctomycetota bacterium]|nr:heme-binding protein [Planctomycetota bacterium]
MNIKKKLAVTALAACILSPAACVRLENGTLFMSEAQRPEGWPEITPVGKVELKERPAFRVAVAEASSESGGEGRLFGTLFRHIQDREIPMTAPVTMTRSSEGQMESMGFLYANLDVGSVGAAGGAEVQDRPSATVVSTGLRGGYGVKSYANGLARLQEYLEVRRHLRPIGEPVYMGYNSPFVPGFLKYAELQIEVSKQPQAELPAK